MIIFNVDVAQDGMCVLSYGRPYHVPQKTTALTISFVLDILGDDLRLSYGERFLDTMPVFYKSVNVKNEFFLIDTDEETKRLKQLMGKK